MEHDKYGLYMVFIVAIVGIVALLSLVMGTGQGDLAGQAFGKFRMASSPYDDTVTTMPYSPTTTPIMVYNPYSRTWSIAGYYGDTGEEEADYSVGDDDDDLDGGFQVTEHCCDDCYALEGHCGEGCPQCFETPEGDNEGY